MNTWFRSAFFAVAAFAVLGPASQAFAQGCDLEVGAPFGLCTAYCEAMDCDGIPQASGTACAKVLDKWNQLTGRAIPCAAEPSVPIAFAECPLPTAVLADDCAESGDGFYALHDPANPNSPPAICVCDGVDTRACIDAPGLDECFAPTDRVISTRGAGVVGLAGGQTHLSTVYCYAIDGIRVCQTFTLAD